MLNRYATAQPPQRLVLSTVADSSASRFHFELFSPTTYIHQYDHQAVRR